MEKSGKLESKLLKAPKGFMIEKSWVVSEITGKVLPGTTIYSVFSCEWPDDPINCVKTLNEAKAICK